MNPELDSPNPTSINWKADISNEKNVEIDDLKFIFAQAEKRLDDGIKNFDATTSKSISFITLTTAILTTLSAFFFVNLDIHGVFSPRLCTVFVCILYTFYVLYHFINIILPKTYQPVGSYPQDLYVDEQFTDKVKEDGKTTIYLYLGELQNYNCRIHENKQVNDSRLKLFNQSINLMIFMPGIGIILYLLLSLLF